MHLFNCAGMEHMKTFNKLSSYDVDFKCEKIYVAIEQFINDHHGSAAIAKMPFSLADFRQIYMKGIRQYFCDMVRAQKNSFEHYIEAMQETSYMAVELSEDDVAQYQHGYPRAVADAPEALVARNKKS